MRKFALAIAALGILGAAAPVAAQDLRIRADERGLTVRTDDGRDRYDRRRYEERRVYRRHRDRDVYVTGSTGCRNVTVRSERPNGDVVVRKIRRC